MTSLPTYKENNLAAASVKNTTDDIDETGGILVKESMKTFPQNATKNAKILANHPKKGSKMKVKK